MTEDLEMDSVLSIATELADLATSRYPDPADRPLGTGPHTPVRGGAAAGLAVGHAKALEAGDVMGPVSWRRVLLPEFYALLAEHQLPQARAAALELASSLVAMVEDIDSKIQRAAQRSE